MAESQRFSLLIENPTGHHSPLGHGVPFFWSRTMYYNTLHYFRDEDICPDLFERMAIRCAYVLFMWFNKLNERDVAEILLSVRGSVEPFNKNHKILKILQSQQPPEIQVGQLAGLWIECDAIFVQTLYGDGIFVPRLYCETDDGVVRDPSPLDTRKTQSVSPMRRGIDTLCKAIHETCVLVDDKRFKQEFEGEGFDWTQWVEADQLAKVCFAMDPKDPVKPIFGV